MIAIARTTASGEHCTLVHEAARGILARVCLPERAQLGAIPRGRCAYPVSEAGHGRELDRKWYVSK